MEIKAILCVVAAVIINMTLGTFYSIGNVMPYVASYMNEYVDKEVTKEHGIWVTATFLLGQGTTIIIGALIEQKLNSRVAVILGCIIHSASTIASYWAVNINFFTLVLVYGLGSGLGCGSAYMALIIAAQKWFPDKKGIFTGVIVAGFGFGGLIFTTAQTKFINPNDSKANSLGQYEKEVFDKVPELFLYMGIVFACSQTVGCILAFPPPESTRLKPEEADVRTGATTTISEGPLPAITNFVSIFKFRIFYIIGFMMMLVAPGVTFVNSLGKTFALGFITTDGFLTNVVAFAAVANALGRLTWGFLIDKFSFSTCYTLKIVLFSVLIVLFPFGFILSSKTLYTIWMLGLFFGFSGTFVLFPVFIEQVFGIRYNGIIYGMLYILLATSSIITSVLVGLVIPIMSRKDTTTSQKTYIRVISCTIIATLYVTSLIVYILTTPVRRMEHAIRRRRDLALTTTKTSLFHRQDLYPLDRSSLAEKTSVRNDSTALEKENSLGSIVRIRDAVEDNKNKIKTLGKG